MNINNPTRSDYNKRKDQKNQLNKYEEVLCKSLLAYDIFFKNVLNGENIDLLHMVNTIFESEDFNGYEVFAKLIINTVYGTKSYEYEKSDFLPNKISTELDPNMERTFVLNTTTTEN